MNEGIEAGPARPSRQALWYVRRHGRELGPHPRRVVLDGLLVGRFDWEDLGSLDRITWQPLHDFETLGSERRDAPGEDDWDGERRAAARRWADERSGRDRRTGRTVSPDASERRAAGDRRLEDEPLQVSVWRRMRLGRSLLIAAARDGRVLAATAITAVGLTAALVLVAPQPTAIPLAAPNDARCEAAPAEGVDWRGCQKPGQWLAGADLRRAQLAGAGLREAQLAGARLDYADLTGADLGGAQLRQARLFGARLAGAELPASDLSGADLSYADLRGAAVSGARFDDTRLDHAWWIDGRRCASGSRGRCD